MANRPCVSPDAASPPLNPRAGEVVRQVILRRAAGESLPDDVVLQQHSDLMPELAELLGSLDAVEHAYVASREAASAVRRFPPLADARIERDAIPGYRILAELGHGGQGVVYHAIQESLDREVAIKVLRAGPFASPTDLARFDREIAVLSRLKHLSIVGVLDRGVTPAGHYFVMDFVRGVPVSTWSAVHTCVQDKTRLFLRICDAVSAAHVRGVIHRDLKPTNILIDQSGDPRILDFGLAKLMEDAGERSRERAMTESGQFVGSLSWASPEQVAGRPDATDTRSDVYALGLVFYRMLTGASPYPVTGSTADIVRHITGTEPSRPSSRNADVRGELDAIVLKCLDKTPDSRYQHARELADDLSRYLNNEPVLARAPTASYLIRKLVSRHPRIVSVAALAFLALCASSISMSVLYHRAEENRSRAEKAETEAKEEARTAQVVNEFLIKDIILAARNASPIGAETTMRQVLETASEKVGAALAGQPVVEASVRRIIGDAFWNLGVFDEAEQQIRTARELAGASLPPHDPALTDLALRHARTLRSLGQFAEAENLNRQIWDSFLKELGDEDPLTLKAAHELAVALWENHMTEEGASLAEQTLGARRRLLGETHPDTLTSKTFLATQVYVETGRLREAEQLLRELLSEYGRSQGPDDPSTLSMVTQLGMNLESQDRHAEARPFLEQAYETNRRNHGSEHAFTLAGAVQLAYSLRESGALSEAEELLNENLTRCRTSLGGTNPYCQSLLQVLGSVLTRREDYKEAAAVFRELIAAREEYFGADRRETALAVNECAYVYLCSHRYAAAEALYRRALLICRGAGEPWDEGLATALRGLSRCLAAQGRPDEARPLTLELLEIRRRVASRPGASAADLGRCARELATVDPEDLRNPDEALTYALAMADLCDETFRSDDLLALCYQAGGDLSAALDFSKRALALAPAELGMGRSKVEDRLVELLEEMGDPNAAEQVYRDTLELQRCSDSWPYSDVGRALVKLAGKLNEHARYDEAEAAAREAMDVFGQSVGPTHWRSAQAMSLLGDVLINQGALSEAEALLAASKGLLEADDWGDAEVLTDTLARLDRLQAILADEGADQRTRPVADRETDE